MKIAGVQGDFCKTDVQGVGDPKPFEVTDLNKDGTIGGGDFGAVKTGKNISVVPSKIPFTAAGKGDLAGNIYEESKDKKIILLGEKHHCYASKIVESLSASYKNDKKNFNVCLELDNHFFKDVFDDLNKMEPGDLLNDKIRNEIYDRILVNFAMMLDYRNGTQGVEPISKDKMKSINLDGLKKMMSKDTKATAAFSYISDIIMCRYNGGKIFAVDAHKNENADVYSNEREAHIANSIESVSKNGNPTICLLGVNHASRVLAGQSEGADNGRSTTAGALLDKKIGKGSVFHVNIMPSILDAAKYGRPPVDFT